MMPNDGCWRPRLAALAIAASLLSGCATVGSETGLVAVCPKSGRGGSGGCQACPRFGDLIDSCRKDEETARSVKDRLNRSSAP